VGMGMARWIAGDYGSGFWVATALVALGSAAVGAVVAGSARLLGAPGVVLAAIIVVLLDLVSSGGPLGSNLLPDFYRWLAPGMPVAQLYSAMRSALYFDNGGIAMPVAVLGAWLAGGVLLMALAELIRSRSHPLLAPGLDGLGSRLVRFFLETWESPAGSPMLALIRSVVSSERAATLLRGFVTREVLARLARILELDQPHLRATLVGSQLVGLAMLRYVVKVEP